MSSYALHAGFLALYKTAASKPRDRLAGNGSLSAIAERRRRLILALVHDNELCVGDIAAHFGITRPAVSRHLRALRRAGLVHERREGVRRLYVARRETTG